ncbi:MAG: hypothetical protein H5T96_09640 [Tissierellales bacterium]|nr:hypothetical protein [Tissierellales bacterium]
MKLYIKTLGEFDILNGEDSMIKDLKRSYRLMKLLQYFIVFREQRLLPENIYETLWGGNDSIDPKNVIKGQVFRLKKGLNMNIPENSINIEFLNGHYILRLNENVEVDLDIFEDLTKQADKLLNEEPNEAIKLYEKAFNIYENQLLDDVYYDVWLVPIRNYYRKLYANSVEKVINHYKKEKRYDDILLLCEKTLEKVEYEEKFHKYLIEALLAQGKVEDAAEHIKYLRSEFMQVNGMFTTDTINKFERMVNSYQKNNPDSKSIEKLNILEGALELKDEEFKVAYQISKRKRKKEGEANYLLIVQLVDENIENSKQLSWLDYMEKSIPKFFRKSDVFTVWEEKYILIILNDAKIEAMSNLENRFFIKYYETDSNKAFPIKLRLIELEEDTKVKL